MFIEGLPVPAADPTVSAPTPTAATPAAPAPVATPQATPAPATGAPEGWVPSYRLREAREAAERQWQERLSTREAELRAESDRYKQQVLALTGVSQPNQNPEVDAVKAQFGQVYPGLSKIEERAEQILQILEKAGDLESQNNHYWQSYGRQVMDKLFSHASESLGSPLTDEGKRHLHSSFLGFIQSSPELSDRYANDPTIVEDFWKAFSSTFIDPVRRSAAAGTINRATGVPGLPQDSPSGAPRPSPTPQHTGLDDRVAAAWSQFQTLRR